MRSEHMDAESDASSSEYGGRRPRATSSDNGSISGSRHSSMSTTSYTEAPNPVVPNANAIARQSLSHADAPHPVVPNADSIARLSLSHAEAKNSIVSSATATSHAAGLKYPMVNTNQQVTRSVVGATSAGNAQDEERFANAQCCAPCLVM